MRVLALSHAAVVAVNQEPFDALARAGAEITLIAPRALRTDIRGAVRLESMPSFSGTLVGLPVVPRGYARALGGQRGIHVITYLGLRGAIRARRPDVVFVEEEPYSFAAMQAARACAAAEIPFVVHQNQNLPRVLPFPFERIRTAVLSRATGMTVRNRAAEELARAAGFIRRVHRFPHAVDPTRYASLRAPLELPRPCVGFVGRLVPEKGIAELVEAVARIGASLLVVGDGPERSSLQRLIAARGVRAHLAGAVPHEQVPDWYAAMDVVAIPSRTTPTWVEQFGRIVIEANAAGIPVVASDSGELPQTVDATRGGSIAREGDVDSLAHELRAFTDDPARAVETGARGREAVTQRFSHDAVARGLLAFLKEITA